MDFKSFMELKQAGDVMPDQMASLQQGQRDATASPYADGEGQQNAQQAMMDRNAASQERMQGQIPDETNVDQVEQYFVSRLRSIPSLSGLIPGMERLIKIMVRKEDRLAPKNSAAPLADLVDDVIMYMSRSSGTTLQTYRRKDVMGNFNDSTPWKSQPAEN